MQSLFCVEQLKCWYLRQFSCWEKMIYSHWGGNVKIEFPTLSCSHTFNFKLKLRTGTEKGNTVLWLYCCLKLCHAKCSLKPFLVKVHIKLGYFGCAYLLGYHQWRWFCHSSTTAARLHLGILRECSNFLQYRTQSEQDRWQHPSVQILLASVCLEDVKWMGWANQMHYKIL